MIRISDGFDKWSRGTNDPLLLKPDMITRKIIISILKK